MRQRFAFALFLVFIFWSNAYATTVSVFSSGYGVAETITAIPTGFGSVGGNYFVVDASTGELYVAPVAGGPAVAFASIPGSAYSGTFVPAGYGALSGNFLITGNGVQVTVNSSGMVTAQTLSNSPDGSIVAPATFGAAAGKVLLGNIESNGTVDILVLNANGTTSVLANLTGVSLPFGLSFASTGFGTVGGDLLVTDGNSGSVYAVSSSGVVSLFSTLPVPVGGTIGLRQLATAPAGFGTYGGDLFVSVSGSQSGGGSLGAVDILDGSGSIVAQLLQGTVGSPYDPRGLLFTGDGNLLVADTASGNILEASPTAFSSTPEPGSIVLLATGLLGVTFMARRQRHLASAFTLGCD